MKDFSQYCLLQHNTFGIEASCNRFVEFDTVEELQDVLARLTDADMPLLLLGAGSNLLLTKDYPATVIHSNIRGMQIQQVPGSEDDVCVRCGSGETWDDVVAFCVDNGLYGAENLSLIPGEVGASAVQNIGAYGSEIKDIIYNIEAVETATGRQVVIAKEDCQYAYRYSRFKGEWKNQYVVTYVTYRLKRHFTPRLEYGNILNTLQQQGIEHPTARQLRQCIIDIRNSKLPDPKVLGNAGSFFMNPIVERTLFEQLLEANPNMPHYNVDEAHEKIPAGWLIDQCGWKGKTLGKAGVHDKQALVLVNRGNATGKDIVDLCQAIVDDVQKRFGISIHPEVNII